MSLPHHSPHHSEHPARTSLESLRKEAKRWLKAIRAGDGASLARYAKALGAHDAPSRESISLRDVQHAIAREHGFDGWRALSERLTTSTAAAQYDRVANALVRAYATGDAASMEIVWDFFGHRRSLSAMRTYVRLDLGKTERPADPDHDTITLDETRFLVARMQGFVSWDALVLFAIAAAERPEENALKPVAMFEIDGDGTRTRDRRTHRWDHAVAAMREGSVRGLDAHGQMTDALLDRLSHLPNIEALWLSGSSAISDDGLRALARLPKLRQLDLSMCPITDRGLEVLRSIPTLKHIRLDWTHVTDAGVQHLEPCDALQQVSLMGTHTGDGALRALEGKGELHTLRTGDNVTSDGLHLLRELPRFTTRREIEPRITLLSPDASPNFLLLRGRFRDGDLAALRALHGLIALNIDHASVAAGPLSIAALAALPQLAWLSVDATDASMPAIAALPHLRYLGCQDTATSDDGWVALARSQTIEHIWGRRCYGLGGRGFRALATMPSLANLSVSCKNVDDASLATLPDFPALRELMPMDVPDEGYRHVGRCVALESLILMYCRDTTDRATEHLVKMPSLRKYFASYTRITDCTPELLGHVASLEDITFDSCAGLTDAGIGALAQLPKLRSLRVESMPGVTSDVVRFFRDGIDVRWTT